MMSEFTVCGQSALSLQVRQWLHLEIDSCQKLPILELRENA
jgi:hypothetical protein